MLNKIYITETPEDNKWFLSYEKPDFQGGETIEIDKDTAKEIIKIKNKK